MKFFKPLLPVLTYLTLMGSVAIFITGTFIFLASQAFYEIHNSEGVLVAYLGVIAGVMLVSMAAYQIIRVGFCHFSSKKESLIKSEVGFLGPTAKVLLSVLTYEVLKMYLDKKDKK